MSRETAGTAYQADSVTPTDPGHRRAAAHRRLILPAVSVGLLLLVLALPELGPPQTEPEVVSAYHGRVVELLDPLRPDPGGAGGGFLPDARVLLLEGPDVGREVEAYLEGPGGQQDTSGYVVGEDVIVTYTETSDGAPYISVSDRWRLPQLAILGILFAIVVAVAGGWRGLRALLALALTVAVVVRILVPLLIQGVPPIPVAVALATVITILTIGLTEGFSRASVAAILGTAGALAFTALLAAATIAATGFSNAVGTELIYLQTAPGVGLDLRGLLLAALIFGAIGVLDDVTVTQAAAVEELAEHTELRGRRLFASAFNLGRSHIAATVNTLFLAYLGASLPLILLFVVSRQPTTMIVNGELVAIEIVRTLVGSIGIAAAVPLTTLVAVWLTGEDAGIRGREKPPGRRRIPDGLRRPAVALVTGITAIGLLTVALAVAMAPLIATAPRTAITPDAFGPDPSTPVTDGEQPSNQPGADPGDGGDPDPGDPGDPPIIQVGASIPVVDGPAALGTVTLLQYRREATTDGGTSLLVEVRYRAEREFAVRPDAWIAASLQGDPVGGQPSTVEPGLYPESLAAGESVTGWLEFALADAGSDLFVDYLDPAGETLFIVALF